MLLSLVVVVLICRRLQDQTLDKTVETLLPEALNRKP